ncbi:MAG: hypothetical protein M1820_009260 [Bogoriella megaspora]|nr:MAG: hypothetical protein M1820_009260 [Bogoriella megaspora]
MDPPIIYTEPHHTALLPQLARLIPLCTTHHNTSLGFLPPFSHDKLLRFWKSQVADPERTIILQLRNPSSDAENPEQLEGPAGEAKSNENSEKEVIGCIVVVRKHKETGMFRGYMEKLMVKPEYMGKGVGRRLVERAEEEIWKGNGKMVVGLKVWNLISIG